MDRREKVLKHVDRSGLGIEIGPSFSPMAAKRDGYRVHVIDHLDRPGLVEKYTAHGYEPDLIELTEEVDFVWEGQSYAELVGKTGHYDWIIASHVIEHMPDLVGFIRECTEVLKEDGVISLVVPDKRYCFDYYRPISGLAQLVDNHLERPTIHSPGTVAEFKLNAVARNHELAWSAKAPGDLTFIHPFSDVEEAMSAVTDRGEYVDVHAWCFVPHSFRVLMDDLFHLGLIEVREIDFLPTVGEEFYITLGKKGTGPGLSRMELLEIVDDEVEAARQQQSAAERYAELGRQQGKRLRSGLVRQARRVKARL